MIVTHRSKQFVVECDNCGYKNKALLDGDGTASRALQHAESKGWDLGLVDTCPTCVHTLSPHWRQHVDAVNAAIAEGTRFGGTRHRVWRCRRCALWTMGPVLDDE